MHALRLRDLLGSTELVETTLDVFDELLLLLLELEAPLLDGLWVHVLLNSELGHLSAAARRGSRALHALGVLALWTNVFERLFLLARLRQHGIDTSHYKLHLQVIRHVLQESNEQITYLQALDFALQTLDKVLHIRAVEALFLLLFRRLRPLDHEWAIQSFLFFI